MLKSEPQYFPLTYAKHKTLRPQIHWGRTRYKVVEIREAEHGVFVLSVVRDSYFRRSCETVFPSNTRKTHLEMKFDSI